jgi:hypothetical protein
MPGAAAYGDGAEAVLLDALQYGQSPMKFKAYDPDGPGGLAMPAKSDQYDGIEDRRTIETHDSEDGNADIFVIGDWGATLPYHDTFFGWPNDQHAQVNVAGAMKKRGAWAHPAYVLNVGDNFYVGGLNQDGNGIDHTCQDPPDFQRQDTINKFDSIWATIYHPISSVPWISVLGNHDYGGWQMDSGWPQQIGYSFMNHNWILPARYYTKRVRHSNFVIDYFMLDSNVYDAKEGNENPDHNICSIKHNTGGMGSCANNGGPKSIQDCRPWFQASWAVQQAWAEEKLAASDADWKIIVTHFPCGYETEWYKKLKREYGLDLLVTGHRHQQELWWAGTPSKYIATFLRSQDWDYTAPACFVTGGGGGIISQKFDYADYGRDLLWYGFFHLTINRHWMKIELVDTSGNVAGNITIYPHGTDAANEQMEAMKKVHVKSATCGYYCGDMNNPWHTVCKTMATCDGCDQCQRLKAGKVCESYCGDPNNPFEKVCSWQTCRGCGPCKPKKKEVNETVETAEATENATATNTATNAAHLKITVHNARNLFNASLIGQDSMLMKPKPDAYVVVNVHGRPQSVRSEFRTKYVKDNSDPTWDYVGRLFDFGPLDTLNFTVMDKDWFPIGKADDFLGEKSMAIMQVPNDGSPYNRELKLDNAVNDEAVLNVTIEKVSGDDQAETAV